MIVTIKWNQLDCLQKVGKGQIDPFYEINYILFNIINNIAISYKNTSSISSISDQCNERF